MGMRLKVNEVKDQTIKDLIIVMSEIENYLVEGDSMKKVALLTII
jgi:hypothetical protein